ncbi:arylesterase [Leptospira langatensis]|uniref:Arylesterase n=1 Tax=Leptospira langatensis TaxID=2484983 RepID=A0A5F1ZX95_9LEPT|nr:arylesterase [Leptospira langatensis]TGK01353.1 arylesterase [Leptospira langatensis]TGL42195.1 arylesterase [Leptospira langatensis]
MRSYPFSLIFILLGLALSACSGDLKEIPLKNCSQISGLPGPEDIAVDRTAGLLYISSHERRISDQEGKLYYMDLNSDKPEPKLLETNYPKSFRPHGISLLVQGGKQKLYVISHITPYKEHSIEVFERTEAPKGNSKVGKWTHIQTLKDPTITSPNDLFVASENEIYVSNDHGSGGYMTYLFNDIFRMKRAEIAYFDGKTWTSLGNPLYFGNGIILVKREDGKEFLYRSDIGTNSVLKFPLTRQAGKIVLGEPKSIFLDSAPDNLEIDEKGTIYVAAHKFLFQFLKHARNKDTPSPTQVFTIFPDDTIQEVYANSGAQIPAASTALTYKQKILISQVFNDFILECNL